MLSSPPTKNNRAQAILDAASSGGYGVPALCVYNLEGVIASVRAAEAKKSPAIIQLFPWAIDFADGLLLHAAREAADKASVPVAVHMDHAQDPAVIRRAAELGGFDGIMVDMSHYEKEENMALTRELTAHLHGRGIVVEAEPGRIDGGEDGVADTGDLEAILTTPEQAGEFMDCGIDWLAPAFGNVHGKYGPRGPQLDFDRLAGVREATGRRGVHLVLHGCTVECFGEREFKDCVARGLVKANINDAVNNVLVKVLGEKAGKVPLTALLEEATAAMQEVIETHMDWLGSSGKA